MARESIFKLNNFLKLFLFNIIVMLILLILTFSRINLFLFYLFFEGSLIPVLFLIIGWGYQPERLQAGFYLLFYTLFASLPMLLGIFYLYNMLGYLNFYLIRKYFINYELLYISLIFAFLVKMPIFLVHL